MFVSRLRGTGARRGGVVAPKVSDVPVRREVIEVPGGVMTVTVFHFRSRAAAGVTSERRSPEARRPMWRRLLGLLIDP
jgi:hypothetical protein